MGTNIFYCCIINFIQKVFCCFKLGLPNPTLNSTTYCYILSFIHYIKHRVQTCEGYFPNSLWPISSLGFIWDLYVLGLKTKFFLGKTTYCIFPWTRNSQCQNSADSLAENTPNASKKFSPKCLPMPESLFFLKKNTLWVSVVRDIK